MPSMTPENKQCAEACANLQRLCMELVKHCLGRGGDIAESAIIVRLFECAQACRAAQEAIVHGAPRLSTLKKACAKACEDCARACDKVKDAALDRCVAACRKCADACVKKPVAA